MLLPARPKFNRLTSTATGSNGFSAWFPYHDDMLEQPELLVGAWEPLANDGLGPGRERRICVPATGSYLGCVRELVRPSWESWLKGRTFQVFETEDASLLMSIRPPRGLRRTWDVHDAEEHRV